MSEIKKYTTQEMQEKFKVISFCSPFVIVERKSDGVKGSLQFDHMPRLYYDFVEAK